MAYQYTTATQKLSKLQKRIRGVAGGTSAGKTISILTILIDAAQRDTTPTVTSVVSESFPHLKRGAIRDFISILTEHGYFVDDLWNRSDFTYTFETGSKIEFFSADQMDKVRGPRRDRLFVNEANNISYETFDQLLIRTKEYAWLDWNPTYEFWFYENLLDKRDDVDFETLTYKDNEGLDPRIIAEIESHKNNKNWWLVFGEGKLGNIEGKIYKNWQIIPEVPFEARLVKFGLDFGYSNDPSVGVAVYFYNGGYIIDEIFYGTQMSNRNIADIFLNEDRAPIIADSAEPKSIDELKSYKLLVIPSKKGAGSVSQGIQYVQDQRISVTERSTNVIKGYKNYMWETDRDGKIINVPDHAYSDAMDAIRYALASEFPRRKTPEEIVRIKETKSLLSQFDGVAKKSRYTGSRYLRGRVSSI